MTILVLGPLKDQFDHIERKLNLPPHIVLHWQNKDKSNPCRNNYDLIVLQTAFVRHDLMDEVRRHGKTVLYCNSRGTSGVVNTLTQHLRLKKLLG
jgi:hypothetical protein